MHYLELSLKLVQIITESRHFFTKEELLRFCREEWPSLPEKEANVLVKEVSQLLNAINFLENRFPVGRIKLEIVYKTFPKIQFQPEFLLQAVNTLNVERPSEVYAFPLLKRNKRTPKYKRVKTKSI